MKSTFIRLGTLALVIGICCVSAYGDTPIFTMGDTLRDVVVDGTKSVVAQSALGVMPIPEPTSLLLLGSGIVSLLGNKLRRRLRK